MAFQVCFSAEDLSCAVCWDIFKHPVLLPCSHSFCEACLREWWTHKQINECPVCKNTDSRGYYPPCNLALKNLSETFMEEKRRRDYLKEDAEESLEFLQEKLQVFTEVKTNCEQMAEHVKVQAQTTARRIKEQFKKLHQFLQEEEEASITALREEEQQKSQMMKEKIEGLNRDILTLSNNIRAIEEELRAEHISFLQNYKTTMERVQFTLQDPQLVSGPLIDVTKHLGNLTFRAWNKMKDIVSYNPVILDPNTAHPQYTLSDDLTSVRYGARQKLPDNPERSDQYGLVLDSEGLDSGTHSWDVEVGDNAEWEIGVKRGTSGEFWRICLYKGEYMSSTPWSDTVLSVIQAPRRVRVQLDWNRGALSFSDPDTNTHLHTFTHVCTDTLFPYVVTGDDAHPLTMLPRKICIFIEDDEGVGDDYHDN